MQRNRHCSFCSSLCETSPPHISSTPMLSEAQQARFHPNATAKVSLKRHTTRDDNHIDRNESFKRVVTTERSGQDPGEAQLRQLLEKKRQIESSLANLNKTFEQYYGMYEATLKEMSAQTAHRGSKKP